MLATQSAVSRLTVSERLQEKRGLNAGMALRISKVMGVSHDSWLPMQWTMNSNQW
jgi:plasmid maintenance system antidote protein VapI